MQDRDSTLIAKNIHGQGTKIAKIQSIDAESNRRLKKNAEKKGLAESNRPLPPYGGQVPGPFRIAALA